MVVALRDVRVRGEIHTIIDYAGDMLQSDAFMTNTIHTGWLDARIASNVKAERPPWHLCVIGAAAVRAHEAFACKAAEYLGFLSKGQLPPPDISLIHFEVRAASQSLPRMQAVLRAKHACEAAAAPAALHAEQRQRAQHRQHADGAAAVCVAAARPALLRGRTSW